MKLRIAAVQMVSGPDVAPNLAVADAWLARAAQAGAQIVALPEYFPLIGASDEARLAVREHDDGGPIQDFLAGCARRYGIWLVGGSLPMFGDDPARQRNACLVFDPQGRRIARYDKIHLFNFRRGAEHYDEAVTIEAGSRPAVVEIAGLRVGLAICYDLRFPELFRAWGPVDLAVMPAAFTATTGRAHWELLLRARAVENQCYVLASAQGGEHAGGRQTWGHSMVVDPWGEVLACHATGAGLAVAELDTERIAEVRTSLPALAHRQLQRQGHPT